MLFEAFPFSAGKRSALMHHRSSGYCRFTARVLAPVGVYAVSVHPHSIDPIRPTRQRTATSPESGLYAMPSLCSLLLAPGQPASGSELSLVFLVDLSLSETPGRSAAARPQSLARRRRPPIRFLFIGSHLCSTFLSGPASRRV